MKLPALSLHAFSLGVFALGLVSTQTASDMNKPAEQVYKSIKTFKGVPAKEIDPSMEMMSAALGVDCGFCHVKDSSGQWKMEAEDKPEKETARKMVEMMNGLNKQYFNGKLEVTCATCHQGKSHPSSVVQLPVPQATAPAPAGPREQIAADQIFAKHAAAVGAAKAEGITSLYTKGTLTISGGKPMAYETFAKAPNKILHVINMPEGVLTLGFDGQNAWMAGPWGTQPLVGLQHDTLMLEADFYRDLKPAGALKSTGSVRRDALEGKPAIAVSGVSKVEGYRERLLFATDSGLLMRRTLTRSTILGILPESFDYSDFREVGGVKVPFKIVRSRATSPSITLVTEAKANLDIPDSKFQMPK